MCQPGTPVVLIGLCAETAPSEARKPAGHQACAGLDEFLTVSEKMFCILGRHL